MYWSSHAFQHREPGARTLKPERPLLHYLPRMTSHNQADYHRRILESIPSWCLHGHGESMTTRNQQGGV